jgi:putative oxidoreductase
MKPAWLWLGAAAFSELIGGILLFFGLLTRLGAFLIACTMITALVSKHWPNFFVPQGIEYPLSLVAICMALLISGGGIASVDLAISGGRRR